MRRSTITTTSILTATLALGAIATGGALATDAPAADATDATSLDYAFAPLQPGPYGFELADMRVELDIASDYWVVLANDGARTILSDAGPSGPIGRDVMFVAGDRLADDVADLGAWLDAHADAVMETTESAMIGGSTATRFDIDPAVNAGIDFLVADDGGILRLMPERDYRVWWVAGEHDPFAIIVTSDRHDHPLLHQAEALLETLRIQPA